MASGTTRMERDTVIEDMPQISCQWARQLSPPERPTVKSPMSDDFPTPRAVPASPHGRLNSTQADSVGAQRNHQCVMWMREGRPGFDELYDISESESEDIEIRLSRSVRNRMNRSEKVSKDLSLVIPSPGQWPTIEKLRSASALSPPIQLSIPEATLRKISQLTAHVPSSSTAPSLDGNTSGDESASLSSCPPTPDLASQCDQNDLGDGPIQLDPSSMSLLQHLSIDATNLSVDMVIELPEQPTEEMQQIQDSPALTALTRASTTPMKIETTNLLSPGTDDELSALSVPSPGVFFSSLSSAARHTWTGTEMMRATRSTVGISILASPRGRLSDIPTSTALQFYDLPWREQPGPPTSTALAFYNVPWRERPADPVEHIVSVPSSVEEEDPITAKKGVFSPTEVVTIIDEIDEGYDEALKQKTAATVDRTALWINAQDAYMQAVSADDAEASAPSTKSTSMEFSTPQTPEQPAPKLSTDASPGKKSVRFADAIVEEATLQDDLVKEKRISPIHDGTFWEGWQHKKRSRRARDVFQHRQLRAEAEHVKRTSCHKQHLDQLRGNYATSVAPRSEAHRPVSFQPEATEDEKKEALQQVERERQVLDQISNSSWHIAAQKQINGGRLITSPILQNTLCQPDTRILDLHGQVHCSWAWHVALEHKNATIYTVASSDAEAHVMASDLEGPENHIVAVAPHSWILPFADDYFDVVSARTLYAHLRTVWPRGAAADEWDLTLRECRRVLKPGGYLEFSLLDAELLYPDSSGQALGVEFAFNLRIRGYDPAAGRTFLPRLKRAGFMDVKRAWMVLPAADVLPQQTKEELDGAPTGEGMSEVEPTGSTRDVRAITGIVGARLWEQWILKLNCEMGRSEERCLEGVAKALEEGGKGNAAWKCLVGWARKEM